MKELPLKRLASQISFFGGANVVNLALPVILIPILALVFTPSDYRVLSIFQMLVTLFAIFIGLQSLSSVLRYVKNDDRDFKADQLMVGSAAYIFSRSLLGLLFIVFCLQNALSDFLKINNLVLWVSFVVATLYFLWHLYLNYCQAKENGRAYFVSTIIHALLSLVLTLIFVSIGFEFNERIAAIALSAVCIGIISRVKLGDNLSSWNHESLKKNLSFGLALIPHSVFVFVLGYVDKVYVNTYFSEVIAGSYFLMFQVSQICLLVPASVNKVFVPWLFNNGSDTSKIESILKLKNIVLFALSIIFLCGLAGLFGYLVLLFIGEKNSYEIIGSVFIILCINATLDSFYLFAVNLLHFVEKTKIISMITLTSVIFTFLLLYVIGPIYGVIGAAFSCLFGSLIRFVLSFFIGMREFKSFHLNKQDLTSG